MEVALEANTKGDIGLKAASLSCPLQNYSLTDT
jgi:hypothetical protein